MVLENRYSQLYVTSPSAGSTYSYSGSTRQCVVCDPTKSEEQFVLNMCEVSNILLSKLVDNNVQERPTGVWNDNGPESYYNCCLVNWYQPHHHIGLHSDDERELNLDVPIVCLSWGGSRRFLLRPKPGTKDAKSKVHEVLLRDGDILLMGGKCQQEFKHEIPKTRKMDGVVGNRISWTIRSLNTHNNKSGKKRLTEPRGTKRKHDNTNERV